MAQWRILPDCIAEIAPSDLIVITSCEKKSIFFQHFINKIVAYSAVIHIMNTCAIMLQQRLLSNKYTTTSRTI